MNGLYHVLGRTARQGHDHRGDCREIHRIHERTLAAMIEGTGEEDNAYSNLDLLPGAAIRITGCGKPRRHAWA